MPRAPARRSRAASGKRGGRGASRRLFEHGEDHTAVLGASERGRIGNDGLLESVARRDQARLRDALADEIPHHRGRPPRRELLVVGGVSHVVGVTLDADALQLVVWSRIFTTWSRRGNDSLRMVSLPVSKWMESLSRM